MRRAFENLVGANRLLIGPKKLHSDLSLGRNAYKCALTLTGSAKKRIKIMRIGATAILLQYMELCSEMLTFFEKKEANAF